jgi:hypothetical protein
MIVAIDIETPVWNKIINSLVQDGWTVTYRYDGIDAGIDFDFAILKNRDEEILFGWDNWLEGEIKCTEQRLTEIEHKLKITFKKGAPVNLRPKVIEMYRK